MATVTKVSMDLPVDILRKVDESATLLGISRSKLLKYAIESTVMDLNSNDLFEFWLTQKEAKKAERIERIVQKLMKED